MIPVNQTIKHKPDEGLYGDCHRACIASILELDIIEVPHFFENGDEEGLGKFDSDIREWFKKRGMSYLTFGYETDLQTVLNTMKELNPDIYYILGGCSPLGVGHSVVCLNDEIVHDPSNRKPPYITGPMPDSGWYWVDVIGTGVILKRVEVCHCGIRCCCKESLKAHNRAMCREELFVPVLDHSENCLQNIKNWRIYTKYKMKISDNDSPYFTITDNSISPRQIMNMDDMRKKLIGGSMKY